jgi:hypothetical protein
MLEYTIRKKKNWEPMRELGQPSSARFPPVIDAERVGHVRPLQQQPRHGTMQAMMSPEEYVKAAKFMDKRVYNEWLKGVEKEFPKGSMVAFAVAPYISGRKTAPFFYIVDFHQEIRHLAQWDRISEQPRSIGVKPGVDREGVYSFVSPGQIRHLNEEEKQLVYLQHPEVKERILQAKGETPSGDSAANESYSG